MAASALAVSSREPTPPSTRRFEQFQAFVEGLGRPTRDRQLFVECEQVKIIGRDVADEAQQHAAPRVFRGEELRAGGLVEAADVAPNVELPRCGEVAVETIDRISAALGKSIA